MQLATCESFWLANRFGFRSLFLGPACKVQTIIEKRAKGIPKEYSRGILNVENFVYRIFFSVFFLFERSHDVHVLATVNENNLAIEIQVIKKNFECFYDIFFRPPFLKRDSGE